MNEKQTCKTCGYMNYCRDADTINRESAPIGICKKHLVLMRTDSYCVDHNDTVPVLLQPVRDILDSNRSDKNKILALAELINRYDYELKFEQEQKVINYIFSRVVIK